VSSVARAAPADARISIAAVTGPRRSPFPIRFGVFASLALTAGAATWVLADRGQSPEQRSAAAPLAADAPRSVALAELAALASKRGRPVYWAGPRNGLTYELTKTANGWVFVRYVPRGTAVGDPRPNFLAVATYPQSNAYAQVKAASRRPGAVTMALPRGGLAVYDRARPTSIYLAYPGGGEQIEVYHPSARQARKLVRSGQVRPTG
jgi:hypothetical protein